MKILVIILCLFGCTCCKRGRDNFKEDLRVILNNPQSTSTLSRTSS